MLDKMYKINHKCSSMFEELEAIQKPFANFSFSMKMTHSN